MAARRRRDAQARTNLLEADMTEPISTAGAWTKIAGTLKDWPLWLLVGAALSLSVFILVPGFAALASPPARTAILFAALVAWILTVCRSIPAAVQAWRLWRVDAQARVRFVITPIEHQCFWGISQQADGSLVTQVSGHFMVKNRTASALHLMTARLVKPRISGEVLPGLITMRAVDSNMHGTAHVSGHAVPPHQTLPVSMTILVRGAPRQKAGMMDAIIEMADADANKERVRLRIRCIEPAAATQAAPGGTARVG
jgi:hypothetical protein